MQTMLDGDSPLVKLNAATGKWCCMLCKRQFPTEKLLGQHCSGSTLHRTNLAEAEAGGRIRGGSSAPPPAAAKRPLPSERSEPPSKSSRWGERGEVVEPSSASEAGGSVVLPEGKMSALEQMELFEKRLKVQAKRAPAKEEKAEEFEVDSNRARTINNQMDWECSECGQFNFARTLTCHSCKAHVNADTKYLTNRLKEMKCAAQGHTRPADSQPSWAPCPPPPTPTPTPFTPMRHLQARALCEGLRERRCAWWGSAARPQRGAKREARCVWAFGSRLLKSSTNNPLWASRHRGVGVRRGEERVNGV